MDKKICVVRMNGGATVMIGGYRNGRLIVKEYQRFTGPIGGVIAKVSEVASEHKNRGFMVAVDDAYNQLPFSALRTPLAEADHNNKPRLVLALDAYRQLLSLRSIAFSGCNRIDVTDTMIEPITDGNGRTTYMIDWEAFKDEQLALLLMSFHALYHMTTEVSFLQQYFGHFNAIQLSGSRTSVRGWRL